MRAIILAAGQGVVLDGMVKCLIRHPADGKSLLEHAIMAFSGMDITVVVGYRAIEIIERFPKLHYIFNEEWAVTNSAYSLGLALDDTPSFVIPSDLIFTSKLIDMMVNNKDNIALTSSRENRGLTSINCICQNQRIIETYIGPLRDHSHDELLGIYKISSVSLLRQWKTFGFKNSNLFNGQTLPISDNAHDEPIFSMRLPGEQRLFEINTVSDYLRLVESFV